MSKVSRRCPVCLHENADALFQNTMAAVNGFDMSYSVAQCRRCAFSYAKSLANNETFASYYQSVSKYDVAREISPIDRSRFDAAIKICGGAVPFDNLIVDLGCGSGGLLSYFKVAGWANLYGVDPAPNSAERALTLFGLKNIFQGTISLAHRLVPLGDADLVCITAVLEHLPQLRDDLSNLLAKLKPGCRVLVEVPALESFLGLDREPFGEYSLEHIQFFSAASLRNLFGSLGASTVALNVVDLPFGISGSLFGIFEWSGRAPTSFEPTRENDQLMLDYVNDSARRLTDATSRIPDQPLLVYGAGSHSARLLPRLQQSHFQNGGVIAVVDGNPNLRNKNLGQWLIESPSIIASMPSAHILVSSFRSQNEIANRLREQYSNQLVLLYDRNDE